MKIPEFQNREVVVRKPKDLREKIGGGNIKEIEAVVEYVGKDTTKYKVGDVVLFDLAVARLEIEYFGDTLLRIEREDFIICKIVDNE